MAETELHESVDTASAESGAAGNGAEQNQKRSAEELEQRLQTFARENEKRRKREAELKKQNEELFSRLRELEDAKASEQGQFKDAWEKTRKELEAEKDARKKERASYAYKVVTSQFARAAESAGCTNPDHLMKLTQALGIMNDIEIDESSFEVSQDSLKTVIEKAQKEVPYLFGKPAPLVKDGTPKVPDTSVKLSDMPLAEKIRKLAEMTAEGKFQKTRS